jgi:signal-transduction protein with cAMP-binding, CBS, and nucleotidyltransferase domain
MSSPIVTIGPNTDVTEAARKMAKLRIRRLPVVSKGGLVGMVTESDILKIAPTLIEITREYAKIKSSAGRIKTQSGYCEICMEYTDELLASQGQLICPSCAEAR